MGASRWRPERGCTTPPHGHIGRPCSARPLPCDFSRRPRRQYTGGAVGRTVATDLRHAGSDGTLRPYRQYRPTGEADAYVVEGEVLMPGGVRRIHRDAVDTGLRIAMRDGPPTCARPVAEIPAQGVS